MHTKNLNKWEDACDRGDSVRLVPWWNAPHARAALQFVKSIEEGRWMDPDNAPAFLGFSPTLDKVAGHEIEEAECPRCKKSFVFRRRQPPWPRYCDQCVRWSAMPQVNECVIYRAIAGDYWDATVLAVRTIANLATRVDLSVMGPGLRKSVELHDVRWFENPDSLLVGARPRKPEKVEA